jgi:hypothetical protein
VIAYCRRTLNKTERNYCVTRRELLAIVRTLEHSHKYLCGQEFHLHTDRVALTWLMSFKNLEDNPPAGFSAYKSTTSFPSTAKAKNTTMPMPRRVYSLPQIRGAGRRQVDTSSCSISRSRLGSSFSEKRTIDRPRHKDDYGGSRDWTSPEWKGIAERSPKYKSYGVQWKSLAVRNGILERHWESADGPSDIAYTIFPRSRVTDVLTELHGGPSGGHLGVNKTLSKVRQRYY